MRQCLSQKEDTKSKFFLAALLAMLAAPIVFATVSDYAQLDYIYMEGGASAGQQDNTATHYINTGVVPSGDWTITASFASTNTAAANTVYSALFCARHNGSSNNIDSFMFWPHTGTKDHEGQARIDTGASQTSSPNFKNGKAQAAIPQCVRHMVEIKPSSSGMVAGYFDGVRVTDEVAQFGSSVCPLYLFSAYTGASDGSRSNVKFSFEGWFYGLKAWDGDGVLKMDLVPARRKSDSAVGVYDIVRDRFFVNEGTGSFVGGKGTMTIASVTKAQGTYIPTVTGIADSVLADGVDYTFALLANAAGAKTMTVTGIGAYEGAVKSVAIQTLLDPAEYIELDGISMTGTSWVVPEIGGNPVVPHGDWTIEMCFALTAKTVANATYNCLFSARDTANGNTIVIWNHALFNIENNRLGRFDYTGNLSLPATANASEGASGRAQGSGAYKSESYQDAYGDIRLDTAYGVEHVFKIAGGVQTLDGGIVYDASSATNFTAGASLTLFTSSTAGAPNAEHAAAGTFKYLAMSEANGEPVLAMITAKRVSDGAAGVYDVVNRTFYQSAGTGAFSAGAEALIPEQSSGLLIFVR